MEIQEYKRLTDLYIDTVYRVALNGCKNKYDADDIVQETFIKLLKCKKKFESDEHGRIYYYGKIKSKSGDAEVKIYDNVEASIEVNDIEDIDTENGKVSGSELKIILKSKK